MTYNWVPLYGEFEIDQDLITFKGRPIEPISPVTPSPITGEGDAAATPPQPTPAIGTLLSNQVLTNGVIRADIQFKTQAFDSACELIISYDVESRGQISAGITGYNWTLYAVREWVPVKIDTAGATEPRWIPYAVAGDRRNLRENVWYSIEVRVSGSRVTLHADGVHVATANLPRALNQPRQVGIWCGGFGDVFIRNFTVATERPKAFIVMQFSSPFNEVYSEVIRSVCSKVNIDAIRADEIYGPGIIIRDVTERILQAQLVIADITPANANVYFEVGYALALNKPIILLAAKGTPLPFDVSAFRVLFYEDSISGKAKLEQGLQEHLESILGS
jgi:hypothetical protein